MRRLSRVVAGLVFVAQLLGLSQMALAQDRQVDLLPGTDLPGFDYSILKDVDVDACQAACAADNICRAFTFNEKAGWCFLKSEAGPETAFSGATSGRVSLSTPPEVLAATREGEIPFPSRDLVEGARYFASELPNTDPPPPGVSYADLVTSGDEAAAQSNPSAAMVSYRQALAITGNDPLVWFNLSEAALARAQVEKDAGNGTYDLASTATYAAINGLLRSDTVADRARGLADLARGLEFREMWRESIATYRASLALVDDRDLSARLEDVVAQHGFRITSNDVDSESETPKICINFSDPLPGAETDLSSYVVVEGAPRAAIETEDYRICVTGVEHGLRYQVRVRAGLPSASGEELRADAKLDIYVPDRSPFVGFANNAYVMPAGLGGGLPITSVNTETADVVIYRIGDRSIATAVRNGVFSGQLDGYSAEDVANQYGEKSWEGQVDLSQAKRNELSVTAIPVAEILGKLLPGAYVVTARAANVEENYWDPLATQWFIVSDLGLTTVSGNDGVHAFVRSLDTAEPVSGASVRMVAVNNEILGEATTDEAGQATFAPGLARGEGGRAPQLLVVETADDYAFLDLAKPAFDLTDRGVDGRPSPGPLDLFATTERGVYRPGESVYLTALLRDTHAKAVLDLPLTLEVERPDGVTASKEILNDQGAGSYFTTIGLLDDAMRGSWTIRLYADPKGDSLASVNFLVEDFEPERLAFEVVAPEGPMSGVDPTDIDVTARYLYGATAPGLDIEADSIVRPTSSLPGFPGYTFGRTDDPVGTSREPLGIVGTTDEEGKAIVAVTPIVPPASTRPLDAQILLRLIDSNGRTVERSITRPLLAEVDRIGIKPQFDTGDGIAEGSNAAFDIIAVSPEGETVDKAGLTWTMSRIDTSYQWYRDGSAWKWEAITTTREVATGSIDAKASGPVTVSAPVEWGRYVIEVESTGEGATSSSYEFYAGYYYPDVGTDTPDTLDVALDKPAYKLGDVAHLRLEPQFAGKALVMVVDDRIIDMVAVDVPAEGLTVDLPVTENWSPGAYVTAVLYRPADAAQKRMPARALGVAYADVDPGNMLLDVKLDAPAVTLPRQSFEVKVSLGNLAAGETAYVAVAAVDLGILNLTNFKVPDPDGWYFGQRQLGVEFRDLYGQLIDPTQGTPGAWRSGGDGGSSRLGTPPATTVLVALHSGIVKVDADGTATLSFDMPDFNGTVRVMAMAWTASALGHASKDVIVRDPVVVNLSPPRFMRVDDVSRLLVEIDNVDGAAGDYTVALSTEPGIDTDTEETIVTLAEGEKAALNFGLTATGMGDHLLSLTVTAPDGTAQTKELTLGVRAASAPTTRVTNLAIEPGDTETIDASYFEDLLPDTGNLTLAVGPIARLNVPELLLALDRYPYGCAEQTTSRALPLLYLNEVAQMLGMGTDDALDQRVRDAIASLLSKQTSSGGFGLWGPFSLSDLWLDSYVTDFLLRARDRGYTVPEDAMTRALDNLGNQLSYASDFDKGGEDIAYALYDLARAGRAAIGDLRYYFEARLDRFGSALAKAQLGSALALYGDRTRAATAFAAAVADLGKSEPRYVYRSDYGSRLRDTAAVLALAAEFAPSGVDIAALATLLTERRDAATWTSTQEDAWTLLAASALGQQAGDGAVTIDGEPLTGTAYSRYDQEHFNSATVEVVNTGNRPTEAVVSVTGIPAAPPPESFDGFAITRDYYLPDGTPADLDTIRQNDRFVVVLTLSADHLGSGQYLVADPLPAGFEIENPDLSAAAGVGELSWLTLDAPVHVESRTDQYVAAYRFTEEVDSFVTAYIVRAVSPGTFVLPGATVEDMYRPELRGNTAADTIEIAPSRP